MLGTHFTMLSIILPQTLSSGGRPWGHQSAEAMSMVCGAVGNE